MDSIRRILKTIGEQLGSLGPTQKLLIASLAVIVAMSLFLVAQYAGRPEMVPLLPGAPAEDQSRALAFVSQRGLAHEVGPGGEVLVPADRSRLVFAQMSQAGQVPEDTALIFRNLIEQQRWFTSEQQNQQMYLIALQNELARVIRSWKGIRAASVIIDAPEPRGFGRSRLPTASVTVHTDSGGALDQDVVDAVARFVAGARAGLAPESVEVINGATGQARRILSEDERLPSSYREYATMVEKQFRERIYSLVSDIRGVVVEVTAAVDVTRRTVMEDRVLPKGDGSETFVSRETSRSLTESRAAPAGEPGLRSNTRADISAGGAGPGSTIAETEDDVAFQVVAGSSRTQIVDPRGQPTRLVATINVPRSHVIELIRSSGGADDAGGAGDPDGEGGGNPAEPPSRPTDEQIEAVFEAERTRIRERVLPHVTTLASDGTPIPGEVVVALVSGGPAGAPAGGAGPGGGGAAPAGGGSVLSLADGMIEKGLMLALALVAMGMMFMMVRRVGRRLELPSAEELVGVPRTLPSDGELIGEADESDTPLTGIEIGEGQLNNQKVREQVEDLIRQNPADAAAMLKRWIRDEA